MVSCDTKWIAFRYVHLLDKRNGSRGTRSRGPAVDKLLDIAALLTYAVEKGQFRNQWIETPLQVCNKRFRFILYIFLFFFISEELD